MFNWAAYLQVSKALILAQPDDEASMRTAVSRAYYAAYHRVSGAVKDDPNDGPEFSRYKVTVPGGEHLQLSEFLKHRNDRKKQSLGSKLKALHSSRREADYDGSVRVLAVDASNSVTTAEAIVKQTREAFG